MNRSEALAWARRSSLRQRIIVDFKQPMTVWQIGRRLHVNLSRCMAVVRVLRQRGIAGCLNKEAKRSRVHWLTPFGLASRQRLRKSLGLNPGSAWAPDIDWNLYGWVCFSHREAIIRALTEPLQPSKIKRRAHLMNPELRMSANNVRDIIREFKQREIVRPVRVGRKAHFRYELTKLGKDFQHLLYESMTP